MKKLKVGLVGGAIYGLIESATNSSAYGDRVEYYYLDERNGSSRANQAKLIRLLKRFINYLRGFSKVDVVVIIFIDSWSNAIARMAHLFGCKVIFYWLGTDVYNLMRGNLPGIGKRQRADLHLAYGENLASELAEFEISARVLTTPPQLDFGIARMPEKHAVLLSIPDERRTFYGYDSLIRLVRSFPDITFYVVRSSRPDLYDEQNVTFMGMLSSAEMNDIYDKISISIRYPEHDGVSLIVMESLAKGKYLICKTEFPYSVQARTYEELQSALEETIKLPLTPRAAAHEYAVSSYNRERAGDMWVAVFENLVS